MMVSKKMMILRILQVLREHSDENHPLSQKEIIDYLEHQYDMIVDRKSVKRNIQELSEEYAIRYEKKIPRSMKDPNTGEETDNSIHSKFYLVPEFGDGELRLLIDGVLGSRYIHTAQRKDLIQKLEGLTSKHFRSRMGHIQTISDSVERNQDVFMTIEDLDQAIVASKKVSFQYQVYHTDKQLHTKTDRNGDPITYTVSPIQILTANGWYYLICNLDNHDDLSSFRVDKIKNLSITDDVVKPDSKIKGAEQVINPAKYPQDHIYMYNTQPEVVIFRADKHILGDIMDCFGNSAAFNNETQKEVEVRVTTDPAALRYWALQYATSVRILYPQSLADQVKADLQRALDNYS